MSQVDLPVQVVRPGGLVAIVDLIQVTSEVDKGFFAAAQPTFDRFDAGHKGPPAPPRSEVDPPIRAVLEADDRYTEVTVDRWDWDQTYTATGYRKLMLSDSVRQMMNPVDRVGLVDAIGSLIKRDFDGMITRPLVATLTTAVVEP